MDMITKEDLELIGGLMDEKLGNVVEQNLFPKFDEMEAKIEALPDKNFVTEKIGELQGEMNLRFREQEVRTDKLVGGLRDEMNCGFGQINACTDELVQVLKDKNVVAQADVARVDAFRTYPRRAN
jgi:hypothetical protein